MRPIFGLLLTVFLVSSGCGTSHLEEEPTLTNTDWRHFEFDGAPVHRTRILDFRTHEVTGNTECGKFTGSYQLEGSAISIDVTFFGNNCGGYASTDMMSVIGALESVDQFDISGNRLTMLLDDEVRLVFVAN